uniref:MAT alpha 1 protein n=1 Tax=Suhomyces anneliseae TaxID=246025 RepID=A0A3Q9FEP3_9ASCO|nr:MAT alpha 1 protein [Suhomyces anneliseae]
MNKEESPKKDRNCRYLSFKLLGFGSGAKCSYDVDHKFKEGLICQNMPAIPSPSPQLKELLLKFNSLNDTTQKKQNNLQGSKSQRKSISKKRNINGFIAFRTFYSKSVFNPKHQRSLSSELAKLWKTEPSKTQWNLYARVYNSRDDKELQFVEWLCTALNIKKDTYLHDAETILISIKRLNWQFQSAQNKNPIEDVYLTTSRYNTIL